MGSILLVQLLVYSLAAFAVAYVIGHSKISLPLRLAIEPEPPKKVDDDEGSSIRQVRTRESFSDSLRWWVLLLMECPACLGFWIGLLYGFSSRNEFGANPLELGFFTCGSNLLLARMAGLMKEGSNGE